MCDRDANTPTAGPVRRGSEIGPQPVALPSDRPGGSISIKARWHNVDRGHQMFFELPQIIFVLGIIAISLWLKPDRRLYGTHEQLWLPPCASQELLGIPCPSCGLTTSFVLMSHGQPVRAFQAHYLGPLLYTGMFGYLGFLIAFLIRGQRIKMIWPAWVPYALLFGGLAVYLLCWAVRLIRGL